MKKLLITTLLLLTLTLTACSASASPTADSAGQSQSMPMATQLIIGTLKLDGTKQDVTAEQAAELLPMWQVYAGLLTSDTAAQEERDGLINQIQSAMTDKQMQAITDMNLTPQDVMAVMQEQGLGMGNGQGPSADQIATAQAMRQSNGGNGFAGGPPEGGVPMGAPPDGGGMPGGGMPSTGQSSSGSGTRTPGAARGPMGGGVPSALVDALIEMLKTKAGL